MSLPTGTVTLLLADIEGSTRLWEAHEAEMPAQIARLDELVNRAVADNNGVRPLEQGEGDSFVVAFTSASEAIGCAVELQHAFNDGIIKLRIGIHTGEVHQRDENNYIGPAINRAARIRDAGHGGQVLLSQTTADLVQDSETLIDLGERRLRDLGRPERIWQLARTELQTEFPPLRGLDEVRNNLPVQLTTFVGRDDEVKRVHETLDLARAVTLTGAGGCGKTRLALHVAADRLDAHPGGVWFVDFAPVNDATAVPGFVLDAMGAGGQQGEHASDAITRIVGTQPALLLLDNCEHLIGECAALADALLRRCSSLTILATSREPLGIDGEATFRVPSLDDEHAIALFVDRARRARPQFELDDVTAVVVAEICQRLDGIPLGIELAAARMRVFTPEQVRDGLHDRFRLLTGGARTAVPRHQTLQASVEWSYALLLEPERVLLHRLSVFAGGFTVDAAEAVGVGGILERHHIFDLLTQLVDKSLVVADESGRFNLLETIRQYAAARLVETGDAEDARRRHFEYFFAQTRRQLETVNEFLARLDPDYDNLRRALQWADGQDEPDLLVRMAGRLYGYWALGRRIVEGWQWLRHAVERADTPALRSRVLGHYAHMCGMARSWEEAAPPMEEAVELARQIGGAQTIVWALVQLGNILANVLRIDEAEAHLYEAAALAAEVGDDHGRAFALFQLARQLVAYDPDRAGNVVEEAIELARRAGADYLEHMAIPIVGLLKWQLGDDEAALRLMEEGADSLRKSGEGWYLASILGCIACLHAIAGDDDAADAVRGEQSEIAADIGPEGRTGAARVFNGLLHLVRGEWDAAAAEFEADTEERPLFLANLVYLDVVRGNVAGARSRLAGVRDLPAQLRPLVGGSEVWVLAAEARFREAETLLRDELQENRRTFGGMIAPLQTAQLLGAVIARQGRLEEGVRILAAAHAEAGEHRISTATPYWRWTASDDIDNARAALGEDRFTELWAEGSAMGWNELLAYVARGRGERKRPASGWDSLTPTERQVVDLVAEGLANKDIAERLFMSVATVKSHLTHSYAKLGLASRAELIAAAASR